MNASGVGGGGRVDHDVNKPQPGDTNGHRVLLLRGGTVLAMDQNDFAGPSDVLVEDGRIVGVRPGLAALPGCDVVDVSGCLVLPGFVQTHVHLCQTLWRNLADDVGLMEWLSRFTWPLEAAHTPETIRAAVRLGAAELLMSGTTAVADMGTVRHTDVVIQTATDMGLRGVFAQTLMDAHDGPAALQQDPDVAVTEALDLVARYDRYDPAAQDGDPIRVALAPRFAVSSSLHLLELVAKAARDRRLIVHTHCAETEDEVRRTVDRFGVRPVDLYGTLRLLGPRLLLAHCVRVTPEEVTRIAETGAVVLHCPSANLKLGSGIAPIHAMLQAGVRVTLGADGAPCNNNLSMFREMRLASLLQKGLHGPEVLTARQVLRMATIEGARALGLDDAIGSIEAGKRADVVVLDPRDPACVPQADPQGAVVYSMGSRHVRHVLVGGEFRVRDGRLVGVDVAEVIQEASDASRTLFEAAGIRA